ncbi:MAG TPA: hypothetical protein VFI40_04955 [Nocardioides sp.]|nr:hypothetical protein [Nocardioides sp.]
MDPRVKAHQTGQRIGQKMTKPVVTKIKPPAALPKRGSRKVGPGSFAL